MRSRYPFKPLIACVIAAAVVGFDRAPAAQNTAAATACITPDRSQVYIPGGTFLMGSQEFYAEEGPVREVTVAPFWIDRFDVTNSQFAKFVAATEYVTDAERKPDPKDYPEIPRDKLSPGGAVFTPSATSKPPEN